MMRFIFVLFCLFSLRVESYQYELAIGAIFQDEEPYLKEWIEFHKLVGVEHFYLYNNCSKDRFLTVLQPYIDAGDVDLFDWPIQAQSWENWIYEVQPAAYVDCLQRAAGVVKWVALIDIDEFLTPISADTVPKILLDYEDFGGVCFNWRIFGHSWLYDLPENQLMIESLRLTAPIERQTNLGVKSIVRPERVETCKHPHYVFYKPGYAHVDSDKTQNINADGMTVRPMYEHLVVNHYWSRSGSYLYKKLKRYTAWFPNINPDKWPDYVEGMNEVEDHTMDRFVPEMRIRMGFITEPKNFFQW